MRAGIYKITFDEHVTNVRKGKKVEMDVLPGNTLAVQAASAEMAIAKARKHILGVESSWNDEDGSLVKTTATSFELVEVKLLAEADI